MLTLVAVTAMALVLTTPALQASRIPWLLFLLVPVGVAAAPVVWPYRGIRLTAAAAMAAITALSLGVLLIPAVALMVVAAKAGAS